MTAATDREILRAWRDTHSNVQPARGGETCIHTVWDGDTPYRCGDPARWIVDYTHRGGRKAGQRPHCEAHTLSVIGKWSAFERGEVPA